jgi:hypothetical protein
MKRLYPFLSLLFVTLCTIHIYAQTGNITITGRVSSFEESLALEGVTVQVKGTKNITGTMADGAYTLVINKDDKILVFSLAGYETKEVAISNSTEYNIVLKKTGSSLLPLCNGPLF